MCARGNSAPGAGRLRRAVRGFGSLLVVCAIFVAAYPFVSDVYGRFAAERNFSQAVSQAGSYDTAQVSEQLHEAQLFNSDLAGEPDVVERLTTQADANGYEAQMTLDDEIICWLDIPRLGLKVPVYRGSADGGVVEQRLMEGAVHMRETSLPVGGESTHAVITAHSGMRNASMFDNLGVLEPGDLFTLWVYGQPLVYEMSASEVVEPEEVPGHIGIQSGDDLVTLVTCTPYGVNSHRLLVHANRVQAAPPASTVPKMSDALRSPHVMLFMVAVALSALALCSIALAKIRRNRAQRRTRCFSPAADMERGR